MNSVIQIFSELSDQQIKEAILELKEDQERNDGIIKSDLHRFYAKKMSMVTKQPMSTCLFQTEILLLKEAAYRFVR